MEEATVGHVPKQNGEFVARMEQVLDVYKRPYDPRHPVVCMDESPRQLIRETRLPLAAAPGRRHANDFEYERCRVCNVFMAVEPLASKIGPDPGTENQNVIGHTFSTNGPALPLGRKVITLVMDNLTRGRPGSLYETLNPTWPKRRGMRTRPAFVYTPKHGRAQHGRDRTQTSSSSNAWTAEIAAISRVSRLEVGAWRSDETWPSHESNGSLPVPMPEPLKRLYPTLIV